jgi:hypothetical protein
VGWVLQDAPITTYLTLHAPIGKKDYRTSSTSYRVPVKTPEVKVLEDYTAAEPHHGAGLQVMNDRTGPLSRFAAYATYAYHIGISPKTSIAAGFGAGFTNLSLNTSKLDFIYVPVDRLFITVESSIPLNLILMRDSICIQPIFLLDYLRNRSFLRK